MSWGRDEMIREHAAGSDLLTSRYPCLSVQDFPSPDLRGLPPVMSKFVCRVVPGELTGGPTSIWAEPPGVPLLVPPEVLNAIIVKEQVAIRDAATPEYVEAFFNPLAAVPAAWRLLLEKGPQDVIVVGVLLAQWAEQVEVAHAEGDGSALLKSYERHLELAFLLEPLIGKRSLLAAVRGGHPLFVAESVRWILRRYAAIRASETLEASASEWSVGGDSCDEGVVREYLCRESLNGERVDRFAIRAMTGQWEIDPLLSIVSIVKAFWLLQQTAPLDEPVTDGNVASRLAASTFPKFDCVSWRRKLNRWERIWRDHSIVDLKRQFEAEYGIRPEKFLEDALALCEEAHLRQGLVKRTPNNPPFQGALGEELVQTISDLGRSRLCPGKCCQAATSAEVLPDLFAVASDCLALRDAPIIQLPDGNYGVPSIKLLAGRAVDLLRLTLNGTGALGGMYQSYMMSLLDGLDTQRYTVVPESRLRPGASKEEVCDALVIDRIERWWVFIEVALLTNGRWIAEGNVDAVDRQYGRYARKLGQIEVTRQRTQQIADSLGVPMPVGVQRLIVTETPLPRNPITTTKLFEAAGGVSEARSAQGAPHGDNLRVLCSADEFELLIDFVGRGRSMSTLLAAWQEHPVDSALLNTLSRCQYVIPSRAA